MRRLVAMGLALVVLLMPSLAHAEPMDGTVSGTVTNGTTGGSSTVGDAVQLLIFGVKEQAPLDARSTKTDDSGRYSFTRLDRDPNFVYFVLATHQGLGYSSPQPFQLNDGSSKQADIEVYDTTTSDDAITLDRANLLVAGTSPGMLQLMQMGALVNGGDRTFVASDADQGVLAHGVRFGLPNGAMSVQMQTGFSGNDLVASINGVQALSPLRPGRHEYAFSFQLPYSGSTADLSIQLPYPAASVNVYVPQDGTRLDSKALAAAGPAQLGGQTYALYTASQLPKDAVVSTQVGNLPLTGIAGLGPNQIALVILGACLLVLSVGVLAFSRRASRQAAPAEGAAPIDDLEQERLTLVVRLAALDERFASGAIASDAYDLERARDKQRLLELTSALRGTP